MDALGIIFTVMLVVAVILIVLYVVGNKLQKKQSETQKMIAQNRQTVSAMIIDKKKMKLKDSALPKAAIESVPKYMKIRKVPLVKVKIGPQIMTLLCEPKTFELIPVKKIVKLEVSGGYILSFTTSKKGDRKVEHPHKLTFREKLSNKLNDVTTKADEAKASNAKKNAESQKQFEANKAKIAQNKAAKQAAKKAKKK